MLNEKKVDACGRTFHVSVKSFANGCAVFVSEGGERLGSMTVSLATGPAPVTTSVIPSRTESLFLKMMSERLSTRARGIALVSIFVQGELGGDASKALMSEIMEMVE